MKPGSTATRYGGPDRRSAPRVSLLSHAVYFSERVEGEGVLRDLSLTGARIEEASPRMKPGTGIRLVFALDEGRSPVRIRATVVRETETGFAVQFLELDNSLKEWLDVALRAVGLSSRDEEPGTKSPPES